MTFVRESIVNLFDIFVRDPIGELGGRNYLIIILANIPTTFLFLMFLGPRIVVLSLYAIASLLIIGFFSLFIPSPGRRS